MKLIQVLLVNTRNREDINFQLKDFSVSLKICLYMSERI